MEALRVLIVDDEKELVTALEERLRLRGFHAHGVTTGTEALEHLRHSPCDVVLLDVKMPGLGGLEIIERIRSGSPAPQVVLLTGRTSEEEADRGLRLGAFEYLTKPVKIEDLTGVLKRAGSQRRRSDEVTPGPGGTRG